MTTWEYKFELESLWIEEGKSQEQKLNELGRKGWELVSVVFIPVRGSKGNDGNVGYFFKRPEEPNSDFSQQSIPL